uniref:Uncharacterized protein n=1 Tax=Anguilla anguilla TaxID=7936 RepID=A0A0E9RHY4_ANGAN
MPPVHCDPSPFQPSWGKSETCFNSRLTWLLKCNWSYTKATGMCSS